MRLNLYWRGMDVIDVELHLGSKGLYVDLSVCQPRQGEEGPNGDQVATTADLSGTTSVHVERNEDHVWQDDQLVVLRAHSFGFGR